MTPRSRFLGMVRDAHLLAGQFLSPFLLIFALSVLALNHGAARGPSRTESRSVTGLAIPPGIGALEGMARVEALRPVLRSLGISGEVGFVNYIRESNLLETQVSVPGRETMLELDLAHGSATIESRKTGFLNALVYLHKFPGPHLVATRGNWLWSRLWRVLADATVYGVLLITITGIYLWALLRSERKAGLLLTGAGAISCLGMVYALCR